jgi:hypothetical protein
LASRREALLREATRAMDEGDLAALQRITTADIEIGSRLASSLEGRAYKGQTGIRDYLRDLTEAFEVFQREVREVEDVGEQSVATVGLHAVGRGSGMVVDVEVWAVTWHEGERFRRLEIFFDRDEAFAAAREDAQPPAGV